MKDRFDELAAILTELELASPADLRSAVSELPNSGSDSSAHSLLELLVARDLLTPFQSAQLSAGGSLVLGNYLLVDQVGKGGMGVVYSALHRKMKRRVAIKFISSDAQDFDRRFHREIAIVAQLDHPNIVTVYDSAEHDGQQYLVMQLIEGMDLSSLVRKRGRPKSGGSD